MAESAHGDYFVSDDPQRLDARAVHAYLSRAYWSEGIPLATRDAHGLYHQYGFTPIAAPDRHMERLSPNLYRQPTAPQPVDAAGRREH